MDAGFPTRPEENINSIILLVKEQIEAITGGALVLSFSQGQGIVDSVCFFSSIDRTDHLHRV